MKLLRMLFMLVCLLMPLKGLGAEPGQDYRTALPAIPLDRVRLGEGVPYCYAGYGTQQLSFRFDGRTVHSRDIADPYQPGFDPTSSSFLRFGCKNDLLFIDYASVDDSLRFNREIVSDSVVYNAIRFQYRVVTAGHAFSLMPHRLYLDLGIGYALLDYRLGRYGRQYASQAESEARDESALMLRAGFSFIVNHYVMLNWQLEKSIGGDSVLDYTGQLGLNFISRF